MQEIVVEIDTDLEDLIPEFLDNRHKEIANIAAALDRGDLTALDRLGHNLKGVCGSYGFSEMAELGLLLQESVERHDLEEARRLLARMEDYMQRVRVKFC